MIRNDNFLYINRRQKTNGYPNLPNTSPPGEENFPYFYQGGLILVLFFTAELSHFLGLKNQKNIFFKNFSKIVFENLEKKFEFFFFNLKKKGILL